MGKEDEPIRKLPLPEIFYNNNDLELIESESEVEEEENQEDHER